MDTEYQTRNCPSCNAVPLHENLEVIRNPSAESLSFETIKNNWVGFRDDQLFFNYTRCQACDLLYSTSYLSQDQLDDLYRSMPDNSAGEKQDVLEHTQRDYARTMVRVVGRAGRWLDLGADIGLMAKSLRNGLGEKGVIIDAVEPNLAVREVLMENLGGGASVYDSIEDVPTSRYAGVAAVHVLDHLPKLSEALAEVHRCLETGGTFAVVVHNERSFLRRLLGKRWPPFCLQHPHLFSPSSLEKTLESHGFAVIEIRRTTNYFTLRHLVQGALQLTRVRPSIARLVPEITVPLKLGNLIAVATKV